MLPVRRADWVPLLKETWAEFGRHKAQWLGAAISYFTMFAIAPLIIVVVEITGLFLGHHRAALDGIIGYLQGTAGKAAASGVRSMVDASLSQHRAGIIAQSIGWAVFVLGAIGLFSSLQAALNTVWDVEPQRKGLVALMRDRATSFGVVLGIAFVLLVSLGLNAVLTIAAGAMELKIGDFILSFAIITTLFALLFRYLPESKIEWGDVWLGGAATALLFVIGQFLLGWYLGGAGVSNGFGAFGSLVVFLVWVNYSAQIMLFGAEFTHVYALRYGSRRDARLAGSR
jgi:membrane protein